MTEKKTVKKAVRKTAAKPKNIHQSMIAVMREIGHIGKSEKNAQQGFMFRGIDQTYNALHSLMAKHGIFCTSEILSKTREERQTQRGGVLAFTCLRMQYTFHAEDGSQISTVVEGEGMDSGDKSSNKAMAIAHKYALLQCFLIPTEEQKDPDYEVVEPIAPKAKPKPEPVKVPDTVLENLSLAATFGTQTFREEWKKCKPEYRKSIPKDTIAQWKEIAEKSDEAEKDIEPKPAEGTDE